MHNLWKKNVLGVESKPVNKVFIIVKGFEIHEHGAGGIRRVSYM